ncbi:hypothetical protein ABZ791_32345 [Streptomyces huasconensis]|uniref:Uncharacterized protein n=1 Tax=Streptomyces huasconensis TaxID=1854574 RepID=A0ABV3M1M0_9ACTN
MKPPLVVWASTKSGSTPNPVAAAGLATEEPVARMLARAAAGQPTAQGALHLAVAAEVWLCQVDATAPSWWEVNSRVAAG